MAKKDFSADLSQVAAIVGGTPEQETEQPIEGKAAEADKIAELEQKLAEANARIATLEKHSTERKTVRVNLLLRPSTKDKADKLIAKIKAQGGKKSLNDLVGDLIEKEYAQQTQGGKA